MWLRPYGQESAHALGKLPLDALLQCEIKRPRRSRHHRLFFVLCSRIADAIGCDSEDIVHILKIRTGYVREVKTKSGVIEIPLSISFSAMDQEAFSKFWDKCLIVIGTEFGIVRPDILAVMEDVLQNKAA